jgi:hypothetical protein
MFVFKLPMFMNGYYIYLQLSLLGVSYVTVCIFHILIFFFSTLIFADTSFHSFYVIMRISWLGFQDNHTFQPVTA